MDTRSTPTHATELTPEEPHQNDFAEALVAAALSATAKPAYHQPPLKC
jgi:hypothetical protein